MALARRRPPLRFTPEERTRLEKMRRSRSEEKRRTLRAAILLNAADGLSDQANAAASGVNRNTVVLCVGKCLRFGLETALGELPRSGKPRRVSDEAIVWIRNLACQKPKDLGYAQELWTYRLLREQIELLVGVSRASESDSRPLGRRVSLGILAGWELSNDISPHTATPENTGTEANAIEDVTGVKGGVCGPVLEVHLLHHLSVELDGIYRPLHVAGKRDRLFLGHLQKKRDLAISGACEI
jgi:transposase